MRLNADFLLDPFRSDARFAELARKAGLLGTDLNIRRSSKPPPDRTVAKH